MKIKKYLSILLGGLTFSAFCPLNPAHCFEKETSSSKEKQTEIKKYTLIFEKNSNTLDIFEKDNLKSILIQGMDFILNDKPSAYISKKSDLNGNILKDSLLCECIESTKNYLMSVENDDEVTNMEILKRLKSIQKLIEINDEIPRTNAFYKFISGVKDAYQTLISRKIAAQILNSERQNLENKISTENFSTSGTISTSASTGPINFGISIGKNFEESDSEKTFYRIDNSKNINFSIGTGLSKYLSTNAACTAEITNSLVFYSLEQFLDSYMKDKSISSIKLHEPQIKKIINSRNSMHDSELKLISNIKMSIENYLKISEIIPQNSSCKIPKLTQSLNETEETSIKIGGNLSASAECFASLGMNVSQNFKYVDSSVKHPFINLIESDGSPSCYAENSNQIIHFLKSEKTAKFVETKNIIENSKINSEIFSIITSNIIGDLKRYNNSLYIISNKNNSRRAKHDAIKIKHAIEKNWLNNARIAVNSSGRLLMLKASISLISYLKDYTQSQSNNEMIKKLYNEIENLSKMQIFSKISKNQPAKFTTNRKTKITTVSGNMVLEIPVVGTASLGIDYDDSIGEASFDTNKNLTISITLPMFGNKILGKHSIKVKMEEIIKKLSENKNNPFSSELKEALNLVKPEIYDILKSYGVDTTISVPGVLSNKKYLTLLFYLTKSDKNSDINSIIPLPSDETPVIKSEDKWILKLIKRIDSSLTKLKLGIDCYSTTNISNSIGKSSVLIGTDTLSFIKNKYNVFSMGLNDTENASTSMWADFKSSQLSGLKDLIVNLSCKTSNIHYELQKMYNQILVNNLQNSVYITQNFKNLLDSCNNYAINNNSQNLENALSALDQILELNYNYNYLYEFNKIHKKI
ncbi:MAG: hypothetical protein ACI4PR_00365 [Acutalibacteraceae bacterium]